MRKGMTLIEILVSMVIISTLALAIVATSARVRENARRTYCMNNLRQIGIAFNLYLNDHGAFPPGVTVPEPFDDTWYECLYPEYLDSAETYRCPSHPKWKDAWLTDPAHNGYQFDYVYRSEFFSKVPETMPASKALVAGKRPNTIAPQNHYYFQGRWQLSTHHNGGANILYWGGYVEWHKNENGMPLD